MSKNLSSAAVVIGTSRVTKFLSNKTIHMKYQALIALWRIQQNFRVPTVREKSRKNEKYFKVREKSGNFEFSQGNL